MEQCLNGIMKMIQGGAIPETATVAELVGLMQEMLQGAAQEGGGVPPAPQGAGLGNIPPQA